MSHKAYFLGSDFSFVSSRILIDLREIAMIPPTSKSFKILLTTSLDVPISFASC